ncbi:RNA polymerase factor sigma-54 [Agathobaculum sp.]|uniref:RNA polymerase factor sigma-54 n=1 Tax=Agathobaculum sp. TaxID=2048138 RepID=UPI002A8007B4|nr:RNA polymerase factor sigma-54 [Agathobaculum sp.]MDY3617606.1 RNA polymerase factor sigma-54 [Agathobaculum sp.]
MDLHTEIQVTQKHTLALAQMQSLRVLAMNAQELAAFFQKEQLENPLLEMEEPQSAERLEALVSEQQWLQRKETRNCVSAGTDDEAAWNDIPCSDSTDLRTFLLSQVNERQLGPRLYRLLVRLVECLDEYGYLNADPEQLADMLPGDLQSVRHAWELLRSLEPAGVGARDLSDCLLLQLARQKICTPLLEQILTEHLTDIAAGRFHAVAKACGVSLEKVKGALRSIRSLNPRPGAEFASGRAQYLSPDLLASYEQGRWEIELNDNYVGSIHISPAYLALARQAATEKDRTYFAEKIERAKFVIRTVEQRRQTIISVAQCVLRHQTNFALHGGSPGPLTLQTVADELDIHPSTVSRTVRGKYVQCPRGVLPFRSFFDTAAGRGGTAECSRDAVKRRLEDLITREDAAHPLRDQTLAEQLGEEFHMSVSRRVVAKYRTELGIKSVYERHFAE